MIPEHRQRVEHMPPDPANPPSILDDIAGDDPADERDQAPDDLIASEKKRRRRVIALIVIMLLGAISIIFPPLLALL